MLRDDGVTEAVGGVAPETCLASRLISARSTHDGILSGWLLQHRARGRWQSHGLRRDDFCVSRIFQITRQRSFDTGTEFGFPGLKAGDRWCLCAPRWQEAFEAGQASRVVLRATHEGALAYCSLADLKRFAVDLA